eukprot:UN14174
MIENAENVGLVNLLTLRISKYRFWLQKVVKIESDRIF